MSKQSDQKKLQNYIKAPAQCGTCGYCTWDKVSNEYGHVSDKNIRCVYSDVHFAAHKTGCCDNYSRK